jgi:hypothetical protein
MSYFTISEDQMTTPVPEKKRDHKGQNNPHFGHIMQPASREAISKTQKVRYDLLRQAVERATDDNRIRQVVREELRKLINESKSVNNKPNNIPL